MPKLAFAGISGATMNEVSVTYTPEQVAIFMCHSHPPLGATLVICQNQSGNKYARGYKLRVIEQYSSFSSISSADAKDCTSDLSSFALSPSDEDSEATILPSRFTVLSSQAPTAFKRNSFRHEVADKTPDPDPESTPTQGPLHRPNYSLGTNISSLCDLEVFETSASKYNNASRASGEYLLDLLDSRDFDEGLVKEFKVMINMVKHINSLIFHGSHGPGERIGPHRLRQIERVAEQVMHYFAKLGDKFDADLSRIKEIREGLPSLGHDVKPTLLRAGLNVWNFKIMHELAIPQAHDKDLFESFSYFYDVQVYEAFAIPFSRQSSFSRHSSFSSDESTSPFVIIEHNSPACKNICNDDCTSSSLTDRYFTPISHNINRVCEIYDKIVRAMVEIGQAIRKGREILLTDEKACRKVDAAEKAIRRATAVGKKSEVFGLGSGLRLGA